MSPELIKIIKHYIANHKKIVFGSIILSAISHGIETLIIPKRLAAIFSCTEDLKLLKTNIIKFLAVVGCEKIVYTTSNYLSAKIEPTLSNYVTEVFMQGIFRKYEVTRKPIDIAISMEKISAIRSALEDLMYYICFKIIPSTIVLVITLYTICKLNKKLGIAVIISVIILFIVIWILPHPVKTILLKDKLSEHIESIFKNIELISSTHGGVKKAFNGIRNRSERYYSIREKSLNTTSNNQTISYIIAFILYSCVVIMLYKLLKNNEIKKVDFDAHLLIIGRLFEIVYNISYYVPVFIRNIQRIEATGDFVDELFSYKEKKGKNVTINKCNITFKNVSFKFDNNIILDNFSTILGEGKIIAFYGQSGSGKTTCANLILDHLAVNKGKILIGQHDITTLHKNTIRKYISNIQQNTNFLLNISIYDNITYGYYKTTKLRKYVESICKKYALDTLFGENFLEQKVDKCGCNYSGGMKQVIHLLHSIINQKSKILILDEPTSALDAKSKNNVIQLIKYLNTLGKTIIIITHDDEVKDICDLVLQFNKNTNPVLNIS